MGLLDLFKRAKEPESSCRSPWFDPASDHDRKLTLREDCKEILEVDTLEMLREVQAADYAPMNRFVSYQQWGPPEADGGRPYFWFDAAAAEAVAAAIAKGPTKELILFGTTFEPGAIRRFADALAAAGAPAQLEMLGLFWYLAADDITDEPAHASDIAHAVKTLGLQRLSLLTAAFDGECDKRLAEGLAGNKTLRRFGVFGKDEDYTWPALAAPMVEALVKANAG